MSNVQPFKPNTINQSGDRSLPDTSIETRMLVDHLKALPEGGVCTYGDLEQLIGRPCTHGSTGAGYLASARRILLRDHDILVDAEPRIGVKICTNAEKLSVADRDVRRARRSVKRAKQKLGSVAYDRLTDDQKRAWNARSSVVGALELLGSPRAVEKIERVVVGHVLPTAATLDLFKK